MQLHVQCQDVNANHVHCNMGRTFSLDTVDESPRDAIADSEWALVDGEVRCPEHA